MHQFRRGRACSTDRRSDKAQPFRRPRGRFSCHSEVLAVLGRGATRRHEPGRSNQPQRRAAASFRLRT